MAGTIEGGKKAAAANLAKDPDFYKKIGARGGSSPSYTREKRAFYIDRKLAARAGYIGGKVSRRGRKVKEEVGQAA
jgi:general stress protein YciG